MIKTIRRNVGLAGQERVLQEVPVVLARLEANPALRRGAANRKCRVMLGAPNKQCHWQACKVRFRQGDRS